MRRDPVVSKRLQQTVDQLQAAIQSVRKRRQSVCSHDETLFEKAWQLPPTVLLTPERKVLEDDEAEVQEAVEPIESHDTSFASDSVLHTPKGEGVDVVDARNAVKSDEHTELEWVQRDVERQARANQVVCRALVRAIHDITDVLVDVVNDEAASVLECTAAAATGGSLEENNNATALQLVPEKVEELVDLWDDALVSWREKTFEEKRQVTEAFTKFEDECLARMDSGEALHRLAQERLVLEANQRQMTCEDYASSITQKLERANRITASLRGRISVLSSQLANSAAAVNARPVVSDAATETIDTVDGFQTQPSHLAACAKSSDLHALRCEVALTAQMQRANELDARLSMLLEEVDSHKCCCESSETLNHTVEKYRQKLGLLEGRVQDIQQQVACDHEQVEYEQARWALEKRHRREKYDEVLDTSVKVLKVLIIREKLMKKNERMQERTSREGHEKELDLVSQAAKLQKIVTELMQQSAMVLVVQEQLTTLPSDTTDAWTLPAKPVQMMSIIKRLKRIEIALNRRKWASATLMADHSRVDINMQA